ncbi:phage/plasmid primase, P4 family [Halosimplex carlsbadense]|uniref:phage/plasmid primase, P4 family n=1 Tax=Halosimplex carlsbadense TaxID=171164 RepID=UPI001378634C|nr:phage/plasmid primase, P4 family [Halosimplex carlsbadense]
MRDEHDCTRAEVVGVMPHGIVGDRFEESGLASARFVSVKEGQKMCVDHDTRYDDPTTAPGQNYGIYADEDDALVVLDVDDHQNHSLDNQSRVAVAALSGLPRTLELKSPHVDPDGAGGHRIYKLDSNETPAELFKERLGAYNPVPSWGEVIAKNKYVVGAGSQIDDCDKDWHDCSEEGKGHYEVKHDREIAAVSAEELVSALATDPDLEDTEAEDGGREDSGSSDRTNTDTDQSGNPPTVTREYDREEIEEMLSHLPGDQHFDDWTRTGYAVYDWDDGETGKEVFEQWSRDNRKWVEEDSQYQIDYIWENGEQASEDPDDNSNASVGTLVYLAKENGWEPSYHSAQGPQRPSPNNAELVAWDDVVEHYENQGKQSGRLWAAAALEEHTSWMYVVESETLWVYDESKGYFNSWGEEAVESLLVANIGVHYSTKEVSEVVARIEARNQTRREELNAKNRDGPLVCVGDGVVNLETGEKLEHSPEYQFTRGIPHDYDPEAVPERMVRFLRQVTQRDADMWTLLQQLGHGLMPGHPFKAFVVMYGPGDNGKSVIGRVFRRFVGDENAAAVELKDFRDDDFATGDLPGKMINVGDDLSGKKIRDVSMLKRLTGGDTLRANEKHKATFDFQNEAAMFFSGNEPPTFEEKTPALKGRLYPIEMPDRFTEEPDDGNRDADPKLAEKIVTDDEEMSGLLNLAIQGAQSLIENGGAFKMPESPDERMDMYEAASDPIRRFVMDYLEEATSTDKTLKDDVYDVYAAMCREEDERATSQNIFKQEVSQQAVVDVESGRTRQLTDGDNLETCWKYVQFSDDAQQYMSERLTTRYFPEQTDDTDTSDSDESDETVAYNATPLADAAQSLTGYVSITAEVVSVETLGDGENATTKAILKDGSGAMDLVTWDDSVADRLKEVEGETVAIENVEVGEHDGTRQLQPKDGLTEIRTIQQGVGHTEGPGPDDESQGQLTATADGGEIEDVKHQILEALRTKFEGQAVGVPQLVPEAGADPTTVKDRLETLAESGRVRDTGDGYTLNT